MPPSGTLTLPIEGQLSFSAARLAVGPAYRLVGLDAICESRKLFQAAPCVIGALKGAQQLATITALDVSITPLGN
jgi:hypothetical protein